MDEINENEFINAQKTNIDSNFQYIQLNFGKIEEITKKSEKDLDNFYQTNEAEVSNLLSSIYDINQIYFNPEYILKIIENKIKKIFNLTEFFLYFKNETKTGKFKREEKKLEKTNKKSTKLEENKNPSEKEEEKQDKNKEENERKEGNNVENIEENQNNLKENNEDAVQEEEKKKKDTKKNENEIKAKEAPEKKIKQPNKLEQNKEEKNKENDKMHKQENSGEINKMENKAENEELEKEKNKSKEKEENSINFENNTNIQLNKSINCEKEKTNKENVKKSKIKFSFSITEINPSDSSKSEIKYSDSSTIQTTSLNEINRQNSLMYDRIIPEFFSGNEEEVFNGKDYESRVRSYLKLFFECCTEKDLRIESNPAKSIRFIYKYYEKIIATDKTKINENIIGNSVKSSGEAEFDFMIKNINKDIILNIQKIFKGNIICSSDLNSLDKNKNYQIIGEVAKNILHQSSDKIKQINKYVDIILINDILKNLKSTENKKQLEMNFNTLNFNFDDDKIIMIVTDGSYIKLLKASNSNEILENQSLTNRDKKDIQNYRKIMQLLEKSKIPYIIFFIPNDIRNNIDDYLIEYAKKKNLNKINSKSENNIYKCYSLKLIEDEIDKFRSRIIEIISFVCSSKNKNIEIISNNLFDEIIETIKPIYIFNLELVILNNNNFNIINIEDYYLIGSIKDKNCIKYNKIIINNEKELDEYIEKHKKIPDDTFRILYYHSDLNDNIKFLIDKEESFSYIINGIGKVNILSQAMDLENNFNMKIRNYFSKQIKKNIYKNYIYYSNNNEYLNGKNLKNKIIYDLQKLNLNIVLKKNEKSFIESKNYKALLNIINKIDLKNIIKTHYENEFSSETKKVFNLKDEHFETSNSNKFKVLEEFYCWIIYEMFFNILIDNILF